MNGEYVTVAARIIAVDERTGTAFMKVWIDGEYVGLCHTPLDEIEVLNG